MVRDEALLNLYYNAADVFVLPTMADNLPNMLIEAVAAGTPCVASDIGGCGDVVVNGVTGYLASSGDEASLADAIKRVLSATPGEKEEWSNKCRAFAAQSFDSHLQAERYLALYEELTRAYA
jgi:glycosyltransferase involved in cell wall biosynthesis